MNTLLHGLIGKWWSYCLDDILVYSTQLSPCDLKLVLDRLQAGGWYLKRKCNFSAVMNSGAHHVRKRLIRRGAGLE
jgi:hypothetical protein